MNKKMRLVIIGGGMAGSACLEEIACLDPERYEITVFGAERHPNYNRVLLAQVLTGEKSIDEITLLDRDWYESRGVRLLTGAMVTSIDRVSRKVVCADGAEEPYDRLILATGALPVIPPITGADKEGVVAFRNIADCERIKGVFGGAPEPRKAVVIGGGLLGLEAAWSLKTLGADVTVVHLASRLMERQLDEAAAGLLKEDMEALGIEVRLGTETVEITGGERVEGLRFSDGETAAADLVIMSVGIRPNAELARAAGIYCEKGVLVGDTMQTYDPAVYAIGECVQHRGETFGLVAPIFEQARVLADHMAGKGRLSFKNSPVPARLKVPGVELYSAGRVTSADGFDSIEYMDRGSGVYKKVLLRDNHVAGIVMYGDTSGSTELYDSMVRGEDVSTRRRTLLFGRGAGEGGAPSVDDIPDGAIICGCKGVTKKTIIDAITSKGLFTR
ncbi:MAG: FAD-dependent oxidoreductase, partial [Thermodesulfobacteriota bacterium]